MHICFVCTGNICRSPMAAHVLRHELSRVGVSERVLVTSAAIGTWHTGEAADPRAVAALKARGYAVDHISAQLHGPELEADLLVAMDSKHVEQLEELLGATSRIRPLLTFGPQRSITQIDVLDPYFGEQSDFDRVLAMIESSIPGLVDWVMDRLDTDCSVAYSDRVSDPFHLVERRETADRLGEVEGAGRAASALGALFPQFCRIYGSTHVETLTTRDILTHWIAESGDIASSLLAFRSFLPEWDAIAGPEHPGTLHCQQNIAYWSGEAGYFEEAVVLSRRLLPIRERVLGALHPDTLITRLRLAYWLAESGDIGQGLDMLLELHSKVFEDRGSEHPITLTTEHEIARRRGEAGAPQEAVKLYADLLPRRAKALGAEHVSLLTSRHEYARWVGESGDPASAVESLGELLPLRRKMQGDKHPRTLATQHELGRWMAVCGDRDAALKVLEGALEARYRVLGPHHPHTRQTRNVVGGLAPLGGAGSEAGRQ